MDHCISISGLRKSFGPTVALDGLDLSVATGEVHGFLGPNGSGKSTTIRILLGLLRADGGSVALLGGDPWRGATRLHRRLAYVPGDVALWPTLSGGGRHPPAPPSRLRTRRRGPVAHPQRRRGHRPARQAPGRP